MKRQVAAAVVLATAGFTGICHADSVDDVAISPGYGVWQAGPDGVLTFLGEAPGPFEPFLQGSASEPGDSIDLGVGLTFAEWSAGTPTVLTGTVDGLDVEVASLTKDDWTADSYALAFAYIEDALDSIGLTSAAWNVGVCGPFNAAVIEFVEGVTTPGTSAAFRISDPNVGFISVEGGDLRIGLQGLFDAFSEIGALLSTCTSFSGTSFQTSELMRVKIASTFSSFEQESIEYNFAATETGQGIAACYDGTGDPPAECNGSGNYLFSFDVPSRFGPLPVPAVSTAGLAVAAGLMALLGGGALRRRKGRG